MTGMNYSAPVAGVRRKNARTICTCKQCNKSFIPKRVDTVSYCSRACAFKDAKAWHWIGLVEKPNVFSAVYFKSCKQCGTGFVARRKNTPTCSDSCLKRMECARAFKRNAQRKIVTVRPCKSCGKLFAPEYGNHRRSFCSLVCCIGYGRRVGKAKRRAVERGADAENVDPLKVFARDKWKCCLCGIKTPKSKRGSYDTNAPELDHIIPLSKGGEHSYRNTQCACRNCNAEKGAALRGQMMMFG